MGIQLAPPKEYLNLFGGHMSIDEFRKHSIIVDQYEDIYIRNHASISKLQPVYKSEETHGLMEAPKTKRNTKRYKPINSFG